MQILFKREQAPGMWNGVRFKLWGKVELDEDEQQIIRRYHFDRAILVLSLDEGLLRRTVTLATVLFIVSGAVLWRYYALHMSLVGAAIIAVTAGFWFYHDRRETVFVSDLMHGRYFRCRSVVELARKEAWLTTVVSFFRQVMESAKQWDGTERHTVDPLPKDEARRVIIKGI